jgi:hypothetical protein
MSTGRKSVSASGHFRMPEMTVSEEKSRANNSHASRYRKSLSHRARIGCMA